MFKKLLLFALTLPVLYISGRFLYHNKIVMDMCDSLGGMKLQDVQMASREKGVLVTHLSERGIAIVHTTGNFGRGVCVLQVSDGVVMGTKFDFD